MKRVKQEYNHKLYSGIVFVAVGVVFSTSVNQGLGIAFIILGGVFMIKSKTKTP